MTDALLRKKKSSKCFQEPWEHDQLDRQNVANYLSKIIGSIRQPFVISLSSPYGTGKTFFIQNWKAALEKDGYKTIYFNAWETDYTNDALIAFISSIRCQLVNNQDNLGNEISERAALLAKKGGAYITRKFFPILAKAAARKILGSQTVEEIIDLSQISDNDLINLFEDIAEDSLRRHEAVQDSINNFRNYLSELVKDITKNQEHPDKQKLIIFVDELDRCRPTYSIEVLECIKHLFNVDGVVFIIGVDEDQLKSSIASVYGLKLNGEEYLKKFIDWRVRLPAPSYENYSRHLYNMFNMQETGIFKNTLNIINGSHALLNMFSALSKVLNLSLRQQAQCFTDINISVLSLTTNTMPLASVLGSIAVLREAFPNDIEDFCLGRKKIDELLEELDSEVMGNEEIFDRLFDSWENCRALIHVMFFTETLFQNFMVETENLSQELNATSQNTARSNLRKKCEYAKKVKRAYNLLNQKGVGFSRRPAEIVYMRLERVAHINVNGI